MGQDEIIRTRATLLNRLKNWDDESSWQEFFDLYWKLIYGVARKAGLNDFEAQDVVQESMLSVAKSMPGFKYDPAIGNFKSWLLTLTRWRIVDQLRKRAPLAPHKFPDEETSRTATVEKIASSYDLDAIWEKDWEKTILAAAWTRVRRHLDPQKFQIFDCYVNREWPVEKVAGTFNVNVNQVYLVKNRVTEMLRKEVQRLELEGL